MSSNYDANKFYGPLEIDHNETTLEEIRYNNFIWRNCTIKCFFNEFKCKLTKYF